jgi:hypothetical protein
LPLFCFFNGFYLNNSITLFAGAIGAGVTGANGDGVAGVTGAGESGATKAGESGATGVME